MNTLESAHLVNQEAHTTVLLDEAVDALQLKPNGIYVDGTFGRGGHSQKILSQLGDAGRLYVVDKDPRAIETAQQFKEADDRLEWMHGSFAELSVYLRNKDLLGAIDGVLLDLGLSSPQLDDGERGFSFMREGPLDMRMNNTQGISAAQWLAVVDEDELASVIKQYGEERFSKRIARAIIEARTESGIKNTKALADLVSAAIPSWEKNKHPATRTFQAIRIFINQELNDLQALLDDALSILNRDGRLVVISFHSLEDRKVKTWMKAMHKGDDIPSYIPITEDMRNQKIRIIGKARKPSAEEVSNNPRSRSAVMRIAEKL